MFSRSLFISLLIVVTVWLNFGPEISIDSRYLRHHEAHFHSDRHLSVSAFGGSPPPPASNETSEDPGGHDNGLSEHSSDHPPLFKALSAIHIEIGTYSIFIIIGIIVLLKQMIEALYKLTHDTAFSGMVGKIEEELMIVGSSSFIFKVILNTTNFGENVWAYPVEFAEILVPLIAFSYCGLGIVIILISLKQCYSWSRAHNLKVWEILDDYFEASKTWYFR